MNDNSKPTQTSEVLRVLRCHGSITTLEAVQSLGCLRLASRIHELKQQGYRFAADTVKGKNRFGRAIQWKRYRLAGLVAGD